MAEVIEKLFSLFCPARAHIFFENVLRDYSKIEQVRALKKSLVGAVYKQEKVHKSLNS